MSLTVTAPDLVKARAKFNPKDLEKIEQHFHALLFQTAKDLRLEQYRGKWSKLPAITNDLSNDTTIRFFTIPGMYGGFAYALYSRDDAPVLVTNNWIRICEGSGQEHEITVNGTMMVSHGFV